MNDGCKRLETGKKEDGIWKTLTFKEQMGAKLGREKTKSWYFRNSTRLQF